jgi:CheY-like chemotaxis protein
MGQGTGLGLATAYGIAKQHQGWIEVRSEMDLGTTFQVFLPFNDELAATAAAALRETAAPRAHGTETILVVEDEDAVRLCVSIILKSNGYSVITAGNGLQALAAWPQQRQKIDLLLTDMVMPEGVTGLDLAQRLLAEKPGLKVIFTSGYSRELSSSKSPFLSGHRFLAKPYQSEALLQAVRESLDRPRPAPVAADKP